MKRSKLNSVAMTALMAIGLVAGLFGEAHALWGWGDKKTEETAAPMGGVAAPEPAAAPAAKEPQPLAAPEPAAKPPVTHTDHAKKKTGTHGKKISHHKAKKKHPSNPKAI